MHAILNCVHASSAKYYWILLDSFFVLAILVSKLKGILSENESLTVRKIFL